MDGKPDLGSATRSPSIMDLRMFPWDRKTPRFYLPGEHPATYRWRQHRDQLLALLRKHPTMALSNPDAYRNCCEAVAYIEQKLSAFEAGEWEAKRIEWVRLHDHIRERGQSDR